MTFDENILKQTEKVMFYQNWRKPEKTFFCYSENGLEGNK